MNDKVERVMVDRNVLKRAHRNLDACQKVLWLLGGDGRGDIDPAYCKDAKESLKELNTAIEQLAGGGEAVAWAYGVPDSAITGSRGPLMQVMLEIPKDAQYPELLVPLYPIPPDTVPRAEYEALKAELEAISYELGKKDDAFHIAKNCAEWRGDRIKEMKARLAQYESAKKAQQEKGDARNT